MSDTGSRSKKERVNPMLAASQRDAAFLRERDRVRRENEEKTLRLRTLRLAKEAAEREAAAQAPAAAAPPKKGAKKASGAGAA